MRTIQTITTTSEQRMLQKQIRPWDAGRSTNEHLHATSQKEKVMPTEKVIANTPVGTTPAPQQTKTVLIANHTKQKNSYQWIILITVSTICILAAINALAYLVLEKTPSPTTTMNSSDATVPSIGTSRSSLSHTKTPIIHRSTTAVHTASSIDTIQKAISSSAISHSSVVTNSIQQLPTTRNEQRKLLKAVQDAKRARQNSSTAN